MIDLCVVYFLTGYIVCFLTGILFSVFYIIFNKAMIIRKQRREYEKK